MSIGIICLSSDQFNLICNNCNNFEQVIMDGVQFHTGKLQSKEIVISNYSGDNYDLVIEVLKNIFKVKILIFLGPGVSCLENLKPGDLMVINEAITKKGQVDETIYHADAKLIDEAFSIVEKLAENFRFKFVAGKVLAPSDFPDKETLLSKAEQHNIYCLDEKGVLQAQAAHQAGMAFFMLRVLNGQDEDAAEVDQELWLEALTHSFWLIKGLIELN